MDLFVVVVRRGRRRFLYFDKPVDREAAEALQRDAVSMGYRDAKVRAYEAVKKDGQSGAGSQADSRRDDRRVRPVHVVW